jgi:short-subunit dehydrogenase
MFSIGNQRFSAHRFFNHPRLHPKRKPNFCLNKRNQAPRLNNSIAQSSLVSSITMLPPVVVLAGIATLALIYKIFKFSRSDCDLTLSSKPPPPKDAFSNSTVWIVGASQGLGESIAMYYAQQGATLILSSRSLDKLQAVKDRICNEFPNYKNTTTDKGIKIVPLDILDDYSTLEDAAKKVYRNFSPDYVVHNVGASQHAVAEETTADIAAAILNINLTGPLALCRATLPFMIQQYDNNVSTNNKKSSNKPRHVVISSFSSIIPSPGQSVYAASKAGLRAYFSSIHTELSDKIGVTVCCPGPLTSTGRTRVVYGATGLISQANTGLSKSRVPTDRAAELIAKAAYNELDECWIAHHPVLMLGYLSQYMPFVASMILKKIGPGRARAMRDGKGGYDVREMMSSQK